MMCTEVNKLEGRINQMKKNLIQISKETSLNSDNTLYYSQKLDELITIYQKIKIDNIQKVNQKSCIAI
ncbi:Spo0E family sporulation regulatory protein-aspartic acid phosphatase [Metabacillus litoralis]|jgi:stage 0 sporulation regulatory protein|uniref:Spo0E family sporulation regulatory protein-aspartic acid phosphatase n=1 Tax=Metabacillus litoralis TaxID=152268 RepID=UPI0020420E43|nr:aspartyl-phosphate phosphatase Spo0E family protein [Metabacillus litoralis]MCM3655554.1 aspartyl-phosphate phosphatase Spo0E family protein [Metabacillus litoralis]